MGMGFIHSYTYLERVKYAVGPNGRWDMIKPSGWPRVSDSTTISLKSAFLHASTSSSVRLPPVYVYMSICVGYEEYRDRCIGVVSVYIQYMVYNCVYYCDTYRG
jgi:hypothetical protein